MLQNIGIEKAWTCTHSRNWHEPNARNKNLFRIKWINATVLILVWVQNLNSDIQCQISPGLTQPVNPIASTTDFSKHFWAEMPNVLIVTYVFFLFFFFCRSWLIFYFLIWPVNLNFWKLLDWSTTCVSELTLPVLKLPQKTNLNFKESDLTFSDRANKERDILKQKL